MLDFFTKLFDPSGFPPRWQCGAWSSEHGWLHIISDLSVWSAYMAIPIVLFYFVTRKKELPFRRIFQLFTAFILACGMTHLMEAVIFWWPIYRFAGVLKLVTAVVSWVTVIALIRVLPRMLAMRTPEELEREFAARQVVESKLIQANAELEKRVQERTEELTQANAELNAERDRFRTTLESIGDAVIATDTNGRVTFINSVAISQTGWTTEDAIGQPLQLIFNIVNETTRAQVENPAFKALKDGSVFALANHTIMIAKDGRECPIDDCAAPIRDRSGGVAGAVLVFRDVSVQRQADHALAEQTRLTALRADISTALAASQPKVAALQACCEALVHHLGVTFARIWTLPVGSDTLELWASAGLYTHLDGPHSRIRVGQYKIGRIAGTAVPYMTNSVATDAEISDPEWALKEGMIAFAGHPLVVAGRVVGVMALFARQPLSPSVMTDLARSADGIAQYIERRRAEAQIQDSEERYRVLFEMCPDAIYLVDMDGHIRSANPAATTLDGYTLAELLGMKIQDLDTPEHAPMALERLQRIRTGENLRFEIAHRRKDGTAIEMDVRAAAVEIGGESLVLAFNQDITARKALEVQVRQAQKLEAIGQLAGGVAHDFNNLLTVVNGCSELLLNDLPADSSSRTLAEAILGAGERGAALTRQLLAFSRQQMLRVEVFDLNRVLTETAKLLTRLLGKNISLKLALDPEIGSVKADIGQVDQVIINLAVNARDAMPNGGTLVIKTSSVELTGSSQLPSSDARPGLFVRLSITDTGSGITPEVRARLFEPFFTTKPAGKGTGLGLAMVYGIVRQSGGFLTVESEVGRGSTFAVYLPHHEAEPDALKSKLRPKPSASGKETVLVVEDDEAVRTLASTILRREGYKVETAEDGDAAIKLCDQLVTQPDLVLTDVVMPGMSGRELAETLILRYPSLKVVFLSGYTADDVLRHGIEEERVAFLQKPYTPDSLTRFVREVLDGANAK